MSAASSALVGLVTSALRLGSPPGGLKLEVGEDATGADEHRGDEGGLQGRVRGVNFGKLAWNLQKGSV